MTEHLLHATVTINGRHVPLLAITPADIEFEAIGNTLDRLSRFGGHLKCHYSVGRHCRSMAKVAFAETGNHRLAMACLIHDAHEAYLGDLTTPVVQALDAVSDGAAGKAITTLKDLCDAAIEGALNDFLGTHVDWQSFRPFVKEYDLRALKAERDAMLPPLIDASGEAMPHTGWGEAVENAAGFTTITAGDRLSWAAHFWPLARALRKQMKEEAA